MQIKLIMFFLSVGSVFVLGFSAVKPSLLHDETTFDCAPRSWCNIKLDDDSKVYQVDVYEFPDLLTHNYTASNIIASSALACIIFALMYVGNSSIQSFIKDKENKKL